MEADSLKKLKGKIYLYGPLVFILLATMFMLSAGSLNYWQAWLFCVVILIPVLFISVYFFKRSPEFLERRLKFREKESEQKVIIGIADLFFVAELIIPGLDYRFGWSTVPVWLVWVSDVVILIGYFLVFLAFKENAFAGRTIEVVKKQKVIDTGPYALVRHPMYVGMIPLFLVMPMALGSFWAIVPAVPVVIGILLRILNEEKVLKRDLPGYDAYCKKVRYRLVPFIW